MNHQLRLWPCVIAIAMLSACSNPETAKQRHFERGNQYAAEKRDEFAIIEYASAVRIDPKFGEARLKLAQTYERTNNVRAAFPEFIRAADALPDSRDVQVKAIELLLLARRFEDAKSRAETLLAKQPGDIEVVLLRASALAGLQEVEEATTAIEAVLERQPAEARALVQLGAVRMQTGDLAGAEATFKKAVALRPNEVEPHLAYANFLSTTRRQTEAEASLKQALRLKPKHILANRTLAALYTEMGRIADAEGPLKVIADASGLPQARFQLAEYYVTAKRTKEATALLTALSADRETFADAETMLARLEYDDGRKKEAHARLDALLGRLPKDSRALALKARWLADEGNLDEALERARAAVAADTQSPEAQYALGLVHDLRRETVAATTAYEEALRLNPRATAARVALSRLNLASGKSDAALRYAQEARQEAPAVTAPRVALTRSLLERGELDRAEKEIGDLLRALPEWAGGHALNGSLQFRRRNYTAARVSFERALALTPGYHEAIAGLVAIDVQSGQTPAAVRRVEGELARTPDSPDLLLTAAATYMAARQYERAEQALRKAVGIEPRLSRGYALLAQLYVSQQRLDQALAEYQAMAVRDPQAVGARTMVGILLERQGKRAEAKAFYEKLVADSAAAPIAANNLAFIYAEEGTNLDRALQLATSAKQAMPDNAEVDDTLGWVYYKKDLAPLAVPPLEASRRRIPDNPEILYHLGMAYAKAGDKVKAREALERALELDANFDGAAEARKALNALGS